MPVKNIECQLAEMQIGRFVSGENLSAEAVRQLDTHLAKCESCTQVLNDRRQALKSMLDQGFAAVTTDVPTERKENLLIKAVAEKATTKTPPPRRMQVEASPESATAKPKPKSKVIEKLGIAPSSQDPKSATLKKSIYYSVALGAVLFGMGYMSHGAGSLFGDSAEQAYPPSNAAPAAAPPSSKPTDQKLQSGNADASTSKRTGTPGAAQKPQADIPPASDSTQTDPSSDKADDSNSGDTQSTVASNVGSSDDTSKEDVSEPQTVPAKAVVHHPRKYVPAAHKRPLRIRRIVRHRSVVPHHAAAKPATHHPKWGVKIYDENGKLLHN
jgi:hypothetical protein